MAFTRMLCEKQHGLLRGSSNYDGRIASMTQLTVSPLPNQGWWWEAGGLLLMATKTTVSTSLSQGWWWEARGLLLMSRPAHCDSIA